MPGCKLLIKARYRTGDKDGDVVNGTPPGALIAVVPMEQPLGRREDIRVWVAQGRDPADFPRDYYVLEVTDLDPERVRSMLVGSDEDEIGEGETIQHVLRHKFKYRLKLEDIPAGVRNFVRDNGYYRTTKSQIANFIRRQRDDGAADL